MSSGGKIIGNSRIVFSVQKMGTGVGGQGSQGQGGAGPSCENSFKESWIAEHLGGWLQTFEKNATEFKLEGKPSPNL